jgi:ElaA protein
MTEIVMDWQLKLFQQLSVDQLYQVLKLRSDVFVVEQTCVYPDLDGRDQHAECRHLMAFVPLKADQKAGALAAYARLFPPGVSYPEMSSIGRVVVNPQHRVRGLGHELMKRAVQEALALWPDFPIKISAQAHLEGFYAKHGFKTVGEGYLEDGIPHLPMVRINAADASR